VAVEFLDTQDRLIDAGSVTSAPLLRPSGAIRGFYGVVNLSRLVLMTEIRTSRLLQKLLLFTVGTG